MHPQAASEQPLSSPMQSSEQPALIGPSGLRTGDSVASLLGQGQVRDNGGQGRPGLRHTALHRPGLRGVRAIEAIHLASLHPKIKHKKPHCQYKLYQECGFLYLSSTCGCDHSAFNRRRVASSLRPGGQCGIKYKQPHPLSSVVGVIVFLTLSCTAAIAHDS
eukprot:521206-Rhodomonas_salina.6